MLWTKAFTERGKVINEFQSIMFTALNSLLFHFRFATKERNGLLFYNGRFNEKHDFIAMEITNEQIQFTFSAGVRQAG